MVQYRNGVWAERCREAREVRGLTREDAGASLGVHPKHLAAIEEGRVAPNDGNIARMRLLYNLPLGFFLQEPTSDLGEIHIRGDGIVACCQCGYVADKPCDFPMGKGKTCDAPLCEKHAVAQAHEIDFCPQHALIATRTG
jgi:hypothetical protein